MRAGFLIASLAVSLIGGMAAAHAGGYTPPVVDAPTAAPVIDAAPLSGWGGGYAGLSLGYAFSGKDDVGIRTSSGIRSAPDDLKLSGANAGVHVGYRWQMGGWVFGPELGYEAGGVSDSVSAGGYDAESKIKNILALRVKTGFEFRPGTLVYIVAGMARAKVDYVVESSGTAGSIALDDSYTKTGTIIGLGAEKRLTERMSLTGEYEYSSFGKETLQDGLGASTQATAKFHNVKLGLNFNF
jgi:outer membrane immunogenic protein